MKMLTTKDVAAELHISAAYLRELLIKHDYKTSFATPGGHRRYRAADVAAIRKLINDPRPASDNSLFMKKTKAELMAELNLSEIEFSLVCESVHLRELAQSTTGTTILFQPQIQWIESIVERWRQTPESPADFIALLLRLHTSRDTRDQLDASAHRLWLLRNLTDEDKVFVLKAAENALQERQQWIEEYEEKIEDRIRKLISYFECESIELSLNSASWHVGARALTKPNERTIRKKAREQATEAIGYYQQALDSLPVNQDVGRIKNLMELFKQAQQVLQAEYTITLTPLTEASSTLTHIRHRALLTELISQLSPDSSLARAE